MTREMRIEQFNKGAIVNNATSPNAEIILVAVACAALIGCLLINNERHRLKTLLIQNGIKSAQIENGSDI